MFKWGRFTSAAGLELDYKIICDDFSNEDWDCLAEIVVQKMIAAEYKFDYAVGVPSGGWPFADAINLKLRTIGQYQEPDGKVIVCEDVWTTGGSVDRFIDYNELRGRLPAVWTVFARGPTPYHVRALFRTEDSWLGKTG